MSDTPRDIAGRFVNGVERRMMYQRGFGDGAKITATRFVGDPDYDEGYLAGRLAVTAAVEAFRTREGLPAANILRVQPVGISPEGDG